MSLEITEELIARQSPEAQAIIRALLARLAELEARLGKTPKNSSAPPSSQHPHAKPPAKKKKRSGRRRGGQPGHRKHQRPLISPEACDEVVSLKPAECRRCRGPLAGEDKTPLRHEVWELPVIKPIVVEYQRHRLTCPCCRTQTRAALPPGVPEGQSGPRVFAFTASLMAYFRQSKRRTAEFLTALLGQPGSTGLTIKHQNLTSAALQAAYEQLAAQLPEQPQLGIDETPTKQAADKAWLWTFVATGFTLFGSRPDSWRSPSWPPTLSFCFR